jgi:hypothetical protein
VARLAEQVAERTDVARTPDREAGRDVRLVAVTGPPADGGVAAPAGHRIWENYAQELAGS